jgi:hypothetical protein
MNISVQYIPSTWTLFGHTFDCDHVATHEEEVIGAYWNPAIENSEDYVGSVTVCDDCQDVIDDGCEV